MNKVSILLASLLGAAAISAQAGELYTPQQYLDPASNLTRTQVKASVLQAQRTGQLNHNDVDLPNDGKATTTADRFEFTSRAAVKADVLAARAQGELNHNDVDLPGVAQGSVLTRQEVRSAAVSQSRAPKTISAGSTVDY